MIDKIAIQDAEQQFTGWSIARNGTGKIEDLIISMGLEKKECQDCRHQKEFHYPDNKCNKAGCDCEMFK